MSSNASKYVHRIWGFSRNAKLYLFSAIFAGIGFGFQYLLFNFLILSLGYDRAFLGLLSALPSGFALLCSLPAGIVADRIGRRKALLLGAVGGATSTLAMALFPTRTVLIGSMVVAGSLGTLFWVSVAPFLMENSTEEERVTLFSADFAIMTGTAIIGNLIGGQLPGVFAIWLGVGAESAPAYQGAILVSALLMILRLLPLMAIRPRRSAETSPSSDLSRYEGSGGGSSHQTTTIHLMISPEMLRRCPRMLQMLVPTIIISIGAGLLIPYLNLFFKKRYSLPDPTIGNLFAVRSLITALATMVVPLLADRWGKIRSLVWMQLASIPLLLVLGYAPVLPLVVAAFWARAALMNMGNPLYASFCMEQAPEEVRATVNSLLGMGWHVGWTIGPYISGIIQEHRGFGPLFAATAGLYLLASLLIRAFFGRTQR